MNAIYVLVILVVILFFITAGTLIYINYKSKHGGTNIVPCSQITSNLQDVTSLPYCVIGGNQTSFKYDRDNNFTLAPYPTYYLDVCIPLCSNFDYKSNSCISNDEKFSQCIDLLQPKNCQGNSVPIAISGSILFYGYSASNLCSS